MKKTNHSWTTAISRVKPNEILVRGYPIEELVRACSFGDVVYLLLRGELPRSSEGRLIEAMLVACCDHSLASPSADAVRFVASTGVPLQTAVAAGVSAIGDWHGGAIEPCAKLLQNGVQKGRSAQEICTELKTRGERLPGYGHPLHKKDPRTRVLLDLARELKLAGRYTKLACEIEKAATEVFARVLPMNVDGTIAALMLDLEFEPSLGKSFFIVGRSAGYVAHAHEQMTKERPFKAPSYDEIHYSGPARRRIRKQTSQP